MKHTRFTAGRRPLRVVALAFALLAASPVAWAAKTETFKARLTGDQEVPAVDTDTTGKFKLEFNAKKNTAEVRLEVRDGVSIIGAHLHCGVVGVNGPIAVSLAHWVNPAHGYDVDGKWIVNATLTDVSVIPAAGCGADLPALVDSIRAGMVYVNVHSVANPGGEIRGQLEPEDDD